MCPKYRIRKGMTPRIYCVLGLSDNIVAGTLTCTFANVGWHDRVLDPQSGRHVFSLDTSRAKGRWVPALCNEELLDVVRLPRACDPFRGGRVRPALFNDIIFSEIIDSI